MRIEPASGLGGSSQGITIQFSPGKVKKAAARRRLPIAGAIFYNGGNGIPDRSPVKRCAARIRPLLAAGAPLPFSGCFSFRVTVPPDPECVVGALAIIHCEPAAMDFEKPISDEPVTAGDAGVYALIKVLQVSKPLTLQWHWYSPDNQLVRRSKTVQINAKGKYLAYFAAWDTLARALLFRKKRKLDGGDHRRRQLPGQEGIHRQLGGSRHGQNGPARFFPEAEKPSSRAAFSACAAARSSHGPTGVTAITLPRHRCPVPGPCPSGNHDQASRSPGSRRSARETSPAMRMTDRVAESAMSIASGAAARPVTARKNCVASTDALGRRNRAPDSVPFRRRGGQPHRILLVLSHWRLDARDYPARGRRPARRPGRLCHSRIENRNVRRGQCRDSAVSSTGGFSTGASSMLFNPVRLASIFVTYPSVSR